MPAPAAVGRSSDLSSRSIRSLPAWLVLSGIVAALVGCAAPRTGEQIELANMRESSIVPQSRPAQFILAFNRYCLADDAPSARAALRANDYVRAGNSDGVETFVVDDTNPAVQLAGNGSDFSCTVTASARTGQSNRFEDFVRDTFPDAVPREPDMLGQGIERLWLAPGPRGGIIYTKRDIGFGPDPHYTAGIVRSAAR